LARKKRNWEIHFPNWHLEMGKNLEKAKDGTKTIDPNDLRKKIKQWN